MWSHLSLSLFLSVLPCLIVNAQDVYGQASCTTTLTQTSVSCCGTIAGVTVTSYTACAGCAVVHEPTPLCKCFSAPVTDSKLTSTETACLPTATPTFTTTSVVLPPNVAAYCKGRVFPAIYPPTREQRCCSGDLRSCDGLVPPCGTGEGRVPCTTPTTSPGPIPTECAYTFCKPDSPCSRCCAGDSSACAGVFPSTTPTTFPGLIPTECAYTKCKANSPCSRCCAGDSSACVGVFPSSPSPTSTSTYKTTPSGVPEWCDGLSFTLQYPPTQRQKCCSGELAECEGLGPPPDNEDGPKPSSYSSPDVSVQCFTTATHTARPCGDCNVPAETTSTVNVQCGGCELVTATVTAGGAGVCVCPTAVTSVAFACAATTVS